mmetsp:Transcript_16120/g.41785  ORF Transcript_16120/g.41785 Transcript_16120/m.41785 type:complete len:206 (-) Transcript_16120:627-1244(-)
MSIDCTKWLWATMVFVQRLSARSHTRIVLSSAPLSSSLPPGWNTSDRTQLSWPLSIVTNAPLPAFHSMIFLSRAPVAKNGPSTYSAGSSIFKSLLKASFAWGGAHSSTSTTLECFFISQVCFPLSYAHTRTVSSLPQLAIREPEGSTLAHRTQSSCPLIDLLEKPVATSQMRIVVSRDAEMTYSPSGVNPTDEMLCSWPLSTLST